jgi:acetyl-CoA hydrolase
MAQRGSIGRFRCFLGLTVSDTVRPEHADVVSFCSYTGGGANRGLEKRGLLAVVPCNYSQLPDLFVSRRLPIDIALLQLAPPAADGTYGFGLAEDYLPAAADSARVVIAEVNDQVPRTHGGRRLTDADIDVMVHTSHPPNAVRQQTADVAEQRVAELVAGLIEDGSTLQMGVGTLPGAVLALLGDRRDLGVHSGLISDGVADLMEAGVINNVNKSRDRGRTVTGFLHGTERLFRFADDNPAVQLRDTRYTHNPEVLAAQSRFVAINSAIEVDLTGQINAEVANGQYIGGVGGAGDFLRAAHRSRDGLPIVALPATAKSRSRVVSRLSGPVSTSRADAGIIVTEFGVADLRGLTLRERCKRMLSLAHPEHRVALARSSEAFERRSLTGN